MCISNPQYVYLLQEREFVNLDQPIYKIGKTMQLNSKRFTQYPKGSVLLLQLICLDCNACETQLIKLFTNKYIRRRDIGNEYFEGDFTGMIADIFRIVTLKYSPIIEHVTAVVPFLDCIEDPVIVEEPIVVEEPILEKLIDNTVLCQEVNQQEVTPVNGCYSCDVCKYTTFVKQNYSKHILSEKHNIIIKSTEEIKYKCIKCNKVILSRTSVWRHTKNCKVILQPPEQTLEQKTRQLHLLITKIIMEL